MTRQHTSPAPGAGGQRLSSAHDEREPGVMFNPFSPEFRANPYAQYAALREAGAVIQVPFGGWMVTRYEPVDRVLRSSAFRTPRGYREAGDPAGPPRYAPAGKLSLHRRLWLLFQSGDSHARLRKLIMKVFTPRAVRALAPSIEALVGELLAPALERGTMEVIGDLAYPLPATVICELLGVPAADRDLNRTWAAAVAATLEPVCSDAQIEAAEAAMLEWDAYIRELLAARRRTPGEALLDAMLAVEEDDARLSEDEIAANATFLFLAGHETTTNLIGNGLLALLRHPDQLAKLRGEPGLVENAIEELLRFDSPVQLAPRVALERIEIEGVTLEPEVPILLALACANHDPRRFERPDDLDVTRADPKPLSFGGGAHYCVGAALARLESKYAFEQLVTRTRRIELAADQVTWRPSFSLRGLVALPIALQT
ncbi:MAG TPA: cytochrome P450 [Kofleriaceae bacterium]|nr:cytochrome P450 [Kofleriaceae bacterium]